MVRRNGDISTFFTFGGRVPASVGLLVAIMAVASIGAALDPRIAVMAALAPDAIEHGEIWRLVTWPFVQRDVLGLLLGGFMLWSLGQQLSYAWSERRFVFRFLGYTLGAGIGTTLLAFAWQPLAALPHLGIWPIVIALLVAWAMMFPDRQVNFWGVLPMTGKTLALIAVGATVLSGLFGGGIRGIASVAPHLIAAAIAFVQARRSGRRRSWSAQARHWWNEREQKRRAKHLKVVRRNGSDDRPRWMN